MMLVVDKRPVIMEYRSINPNIFIEDDVDLDTRIELTRRLNRDVYEVVVEELPDIVANGMAGAKVTIFVKPTKATEVYYERTGKVPEFLFVENILGG